jgi:hypothetical protein
LKIKPDKPDPTSSNITKPDVQIDPTISNDVKPTFWNDLKGPLVQMLPVFLYENIFGVTC